MTDNPTDKSREIATQPPGPANALFQQQYARLAAVSLERIELACQAPGQAHLRRLLPLLTDLHSQFGALLQVIYGYELTGALDVECRWYASLLAHRASPHDAFALLLDSWIVAIEGLLPPPACHQLSAPLQAIRAQLPASVALAEEPRAANEDLKKLVASAVAGDLRAARAALADKLASGVAPHTLVPELLLASMAEIGTGWERGRYTIYEEHIASGVMTRLLGVLPAMGAPAPAIGRKALVAGAPGDAMPIISLALAVYLELRGWTVLSLGQGLPAEEIAQAVAAWRPDVVFISQPLLACLPGVLEILDVVRTGQASPRIVVGGAGAQLAGELLASRVPVAQTFEQGHHLALHGGNGHA